MSSRETGLPAVLAALLATAVLAGCGKAQEPPAAAVEGPAGGTPPTSSAPAAERTGPAVTLTEADDGGGVVLKRGQVVEVRLPADRGSGFTWVPAASMLPVIGTDGVPRFEAENGAPDTTSGIEIWRFVGREPGHAHVVFEYRRPLEADATPYQTIMYHFDVQ